MIQEDKMIQKDEAVRTAQDLWDPCLGDGNYRNPVLYADYSDLDVVKVGEDFFMTASSFTYVPGVPLLHSRDCVNWTLINYCVRELPFERYNRPCHGCGTWAPAIRYHEGEYFVFIPMPDEGIFMVKTRDPWGEWSPMHCVVPQKGWIDPCPFWDVDGKAYLIFAYANSRCGIKHRLSLCEMRPDGTGLIGEPVTVFDGILTNPTLEGPKLYKRDGYYYIFAPAGGVENGWQTVLRSENIYGPYEYRIVMHQGNTEINGPHQGAYVEDSDGRGYFLHFQDREAYGRICHMQPVCWVGGWPFIGQEQNGDGIGEPVSEWEIPHTREKMCTEKKRGIPVSDEFDREELGLQWQWQANPQKTWYSLTEKPGCLRMYMLNNPHREENLLWYAPNLLTQLLQAPAFSATVCVTLSPDREGDLCGIGMTGLSYTYLGVVHREGQLRLELWKGCVTEKEGEGKAQEERAAETILNFKPAVPSECPGNRSVFLKLILNGNGIYSYQFAVEDTPDRYQEIPGEYKLERGTWTGAKFALIALNRDNRRSAGYGDFEFVRFGRIERQREER